MCRLSTLPSTTKVCLQNLHEHLSKEITMNKNFRFISVALSLLLCFTAIAFGQKNAGTIEGTVTDPNGAVVSGATVTATSTGSGTAGFNQTTTTDTNGFYHFD